MSKLSIKLASIVLALGSLAPAAIANTVDLYYGPYAYSVGGEFTAVTDPNIYNQYYNARTLVNVGTAVNPIIGFETFCVQTEVDYTPFNWGGPTYNISTSLASVGVPDAFPLTEGAAWLYAQFANGTLSGYNYVNTATRINDAGILQSALWALQGGQSLGGFPSGTSGNPYYNDAVLALGAANLETPVTAGHSFGVEVLNLTSQSNPYGPAQNQLVYVPDGGSTVAMLGVAFCGLAMYRRRN